MRHPYRYPSVTVYHQTGSRRAFAPVAWLAAGPAAHTHVGENPRN